MSAPAGRTAEPAGIVVQRGDSLWGIVARHLGPQASAAEVAEQWPRWYAANRRVIGPEPDRVLPGQIVRAPTATADGEQ